MSDDTNESLRNDSKEEYNIKDIVNDIESGKIHMKDIINKYNLTSYKYYRILKELEITNEFCNKRGPKGPTGKKKSYHTGPKITKFKKMLNGNDSEDKTDCNLFDIENFKKDSKDGMKLTDLMDKYKLTLYQVRELRKKFDLKTK